MRAYHYTSLEATLQILNRTKADSLPRLHFTNIRYCNDQSEFTHGINLFRQYCGKLLKGTTNSATKKKLTSGQYGFLGIEEEVVPYYIACFSTKVEDYSQWMLYGDNGQGACLEFDVDELKESIERDSPSISIAQKPVVYDESIKNQVIGECVKEYLQTGIMMDFFEHIPTIKNSAFQSESELRLIINTADKSDSLFRYRASKGRIIPYLSVPFSEAALKGVKLGPRAKYPVNKKTMESFLRQQDIRVDCTYSSID